MRESVARTQDAGASPGRRPGVAEPPRDAPLEERIRFCLRYAVLAPSSHNTQPWRFRIGDRTVDVLADHHRTLGVADPDGRERTISCGAALHHLCLAARRFGMDPRIDRVPTGGDEFLARVTLEPSARELSEAERRRFLAIPDRLTQRCAYSDRPPPQEALDRLRAAAAEQGAEIVVLSDAESRARLGSLVAQADRVQFGDRAFRRELAHWMRPNGSRSRDGIPGRAMGAGPIASALAPLIVRSFDLGPSQARKDRRLVIAAPAIAVIGSGADRPEAWVRTGEALSAVTLEATASGLAHAYLNQVVQAPGIRNELRALVPDLPHPQLVLRLGFASPTPHSTPRRPLDEVIVPH